MIRFRITNYKVAQFVFVILKFIFVRILNKGVVFDKMVGVDYRDKIIDKYYLIQVR